MLICAAIIGLISSCIVVWFGVHTPNPTTEEDIQHEEFVELQSSLGNSIAEDLANFVSISLAIISAAATKEREGDEKSTAIS